MKILGKKNQRITKIELFLRLGSSGKEVGNGYEKSRFKSL